MSGAERWHAKADALAVTRKWSALLKLLAVDGPNRANADLTHRTARVPIGGTHCHRCPETSTVTDVLMQNCHRCPETPQLGSAGSGRRLQSSAPRSAFRGEAIGLVKPWTVSGPAVRACRTARTAKRPRPGLGRSRSVPALAPYRLTVPTASVRRRELSAILPAGPVEATARTLIRPLRSARRLLPLASFTLTFSAAPGAIV